MAYCEWHNPKGGTEWKITSKGIEVRGKGRIRTKGEPISMKTLWSDFGDALKQASWEFDVPVDIVAAMIPIEASRTDDFHFDPKSIREEPGYVSDEKTPHLVSPGLMQTLISTAREVAKRHDVVDPSEVNRDLLFDPFHSIMLGTAYLSDLISRYNADPVLMCAAYNAGGVYRSRDPENPWNLLVYGPSRITRYIRWFNDFRAIIRSGDIEVDDSMVTDLCPSS
jgi:hypothetical protein